MKAEELISQIEKLQRRWEYHAIEHRAKRDNNNPRYNAYDHGVATGYLKALNTFKDLTRRLNDDGNLSWCSVKEYLPPVDEEVIVLTDIIAEDSIKIGLGRICFAHIVNPDLTVDIDGKPYKVVSHNGWNIPGVKYWMPMPKIPEEK